jgi:hypothetical protein
MRIKKVDSKSIFLQEETEVKFKIAGNMREVQFSAGVNRRCPIQNISKDKYLDRETGEIKERKKSENRYQSPKSVRKSINKLMDLIRCNAIEKSYCKWLTLTYADAMTDHEKVYEDGKMFLRRLQRYLNNQTDLSDGQKKFKRITVAEPQGEKHDNSWHLHILLIFEDAAPFISNDTITELWGYGITYTHKVYDSDGLALYFKVYLSDVEYIKGNEDYDVVDKVVNGESKQFIKGGRLKYYPTGMPLFSASRGMRRPVVEKISHKEAMERVSDCQLVYRETFLIGEDKKDGNIIDKRYYKKN